MNPPYCIQTNLQTCDKLLVVISQIVENLQTEDRLNLLTEIAIKVHSKSKLDEDSFEDILDLMLLHVDTEVALELENQIWQKIQLGNQGCQFEIGGSQAWKLD